MENLNIWYNQKLEDAQFNRLRVMALMLLVQTCLIIPATTLLVSMNGFNPVAIGVSIISFGILVARYPDYQ